MLILVVDSSIEGGLFMSKKNTYDQKHLSTSQRIHIEKGLNDGLSFAAIARKLNKHPSTIAKEVKNIVLFSLGKMIRKSLSGVHFSKIAPCAFSVMKKAALKCARVAMM